MLTQPLPASPSLSCPPDPRGLGGLLALSQRGEVALPLVEVRVRATLTGTIARTVVEQRFRNALATPMEAIHLFPTPENGALTEVELRCGELVVQAECREKKEAEATFAAARQAGHRAALVTRERDDIHTLRVTNLPPGEEVSVRIVIVEQLEADGGLTRWRFPTTIAPRYLPGDATGHAGPGVLPDTDVVPDASRLQPPVRLEGGTRLDLEVMVEGRPTRVASSLHAVSMELGEGIRVAPAASATCDRDFILGISYAAPATTGAHAWTDGEYTLVTVDPPSREIPAALPRDAVFVIDISGSMEGEKLTAATAALGLALKGLCPGDRFRLIAFDDQVEAYSGDFVAYDDRSMARAQAWITKLRARGGTEMLPAIQAALAGETPSGRLRTVLFITDGQAHNEAQLIAAVANRRGAARFFTLGIDTAVNASLLKKLAEAGGGTCDLCTPRDDIAAVVGRIEARFGTPLADELRAFGGEEARPVGRALFLGRPASFLVAGAPPVVRVTGRMASGPLSVEVAPVRAPTSLRALWARERVAWLEERLVLRPFEEEALLPEILRVALAAGIASRCTAFVAVERSRVVTGGVTEVVQPHELPSGWDESFRSGPPLGGPGGGMPMLAPAAAPMAKRARLAKPAGRLEEEDDVDLMAVSPMVAESADPFYDASPPAKAGLLGRLVDKARELATPALRSAPPPAPPPPSPVSAPVTYGGAPRATRRAGASRDEGAAVVGVAAVVAQLSAEGSLAGDVGRTAAGLVLLVRAGSTRLEGAHQRLVRKMAAWLQARASDPLAALALAYLAAVEADQAPPADLTSLHGCGAEGRWLAAPAPV